MQVYIIIFVAALCLTLYRKETKLSLALLVFMFIVTAFRSEDVGADTYNYLYMFSHETGSNLDYSSRTVEYLNIGAYSLLSNYNLDTRYILVFYAVISYVLLFVISRKYRIRLSHLLLFFFLTNLFIKNLNISRQIVSVTILIWGISYIYNDKVKTSLLFFLFVALAGGFHASSYLYVFLYIFRFTKDKSLSNAPIAVFLVSLVFILNIISLEPIMRSLMPIEYSIYSKSLSHTYSGSLLGLLFIIINLAIQCILLKRYKGPQYLLFAFCIIVNSTTVGMDFVVGRITLVFSLFLCLVFSQFFGNNKLSGIDLILFVFILVTKTYFAFTSILRDPDLIPYKFDFSLLVK